jgi:hypothetical protein
LFIPAPHQSSIPQTLRHALLQRATYSSDEPTIEGQNIAHTVVIQVSTAAAQGWTGIPNIPFVVRNANALRMDAIFWIETVQPSNGDPFLQLQFVQRLKVFEDN